MTEVQPRQVWADNDPRSEDRTLRVDSIDSGKAVCTVLTARGGHDAQAGPFPARPVRIRLDRFRPTSAGYRLLKSDS